MTLDQQLERLVRSGFQLLPAWQISTHYVIERDGFIALVEKRPDGAFGNIGAPGLLAGESFAMLIWKEDRPFFVAKGKEQPATNEQVEALRRFDSDLRNSIG